MFAEVVLSQPADDRGPCALCKLRLSAASAALGLGSSLDDLGLKSIWLPKLYP